MSVEIELKEEIKSLLVKQGKLIEAGENDAAMELRWQIQAARNKLYLIKVSQRIV